MITYTDKKNIHWNYFISIEDDLYKLSRYIEFDKKNETVFSIELVRLLIASSSEFEVVAKELYKIKSQNNRTGNIRKNLQLFYPFISDLEIIVPRFGLQYTPLLNWKTDNDCEWWNSYNLVKHLRNSSYEKANLKNAINSIGALYIVNLFYYNALQEKNNGTSVAMEQTTLELKPKPCLIKVNRPEFYMIPYNNAYSD